MKQKTGKHEVDQYHKENSMTIDQINFPAIGILNTPFKTISDMPIQPGGAAGVRGTLILHDGYVEGLQDLEAFSHIYLIYYFI